MSHQIDFVLDEDQDVMFKSSDGKLFSVSKARAMESKVWKDMLKLGQNQKEDPGIVSLSEDSKDLSLFLKVLSARDWFLEAPEELQNLKADAFISLIDAAAKYNAEVVLGFLFLELRKRFWPHMGELKDWKVFTEDGWDATQILRFFVTAQTLSFPKLSFISAKMTLLIPDLVKDQTEESSKLIDFRLHYLPLLAFRERWDQIKTSICSANCFDGPMIHFTYKFDESIKSRVKEQERDIIRDRAKKIDQALFDLEYGGLDELSTAEDKSK